MGTKSCLLPSRLWVKTTCTTMLPLSGLLVLVSFWCRSTQCLLLGVELPLQVSGEEVSEGGGSWVL